MLEVINILQGSVGVCGVRGESAKARVISNTPNCPRSFCSLYHSTNFLSQITGQEKLDRAIDILRVHLCAFGSLDNKGSKSVGYIM